MAVYSIMTAVVTLTGQNCTNSLFSPHFKLETRYREIQNWKERQRRHRSRQQHLLVQLFLELEPQLREVIQCFYDSRYGQCLKLLDELKVTISK